MAETRYFGQFSNHADMVQEFSHYGQPAPDGMATEDEVLFAVYGTPSYEGYALVIFQRDGKLYEVNGSHCSCHGLEGQWEPEETSWEALRMRKLDAHSDYPAEAHHAYGALVRGSTQAGE